MREVPLSAQPIPVEPGSPVAAADDLPLTIGALLRRRAQETPDVDILVCDDERLTYGAAETLSRHVAGRLVALGAGPGTHVAIVEPNGASFVVTWLAAARIGAVSIPMSTFSTPGELRELVVRSDASILVTRDRYRSHDYVQKLSAALPSLDLSDPGPHYLADAPCLRRVFVDGAEGGGGGWPESSTFGYLLQGDATTEETVLAGLEAAVTPADRMAIVYTSGSTAAPKGVVHCHGGMIRNLHNLNRIRGLQAGTKIFSNSPMFWIAGLAFNLVGVLTAGATLVCSNSLDPVVTLDLLDRERPQLVNGFAQTVAHVVAHPAFRERDLSYIRRGNLYALMPDDVRPADPELRHNMLGMTETGSVCLIESDESDLPESLRGSFGRPVPDLQTRIVDLGTGADCPDGRPGELWLRGPMLMEGYYGKERSETFTPDGWFRTGDVFVRDEAGYYFFKGRSGDMIKTSGANVSPREVEGAISEVTGGTASIVFGLPDPDRGQVVVAVLLSPDRDTDTGAVLEGLRDRLSHFKVPRRILVLDPLEVPLRSSGKPDLNRIADWVRARGGPGGEDAADAGS